MGNSFRPRHLAGESRYQPLNVIVPQSVSNNKRFLLVSVASSNFNLLIYTTKIACWYLMVGLIYLFILLTTDL